jgi:hypothetical protein
MAASMAADRGEILRFTRFVLSFYLLIASF